MLTIRPDDPLGFSIRERPRERPRLFWTRPREAGSLQDPPIATLSRHEEIEAIAHWKVIPYDWVTHSDRKKSVPESTIQAKMIRERVIKRPRAPRRKGGHKIGSRLASEIEAGLR